MSIAPLMLAASFAAAAPAAPAPLFARPPQPGPSVPAAPRSEPAPERTLLIVQGLERRLLVLSRAIHERQEVFALQSARKLGLLAALSSAGADALITPDMKSEATALAGDYKKDTEELAFESTVIALRLQAYRETGVLPKTVPNEKEIREALTSWETKTPGDPVDPQTGARGSRPLPLDLKKLMIDVRRFQEYLAPKPPRPAPAPRRETLPSAPPAPERAPREAPRPAIMRDAGKGRAATDPLPELISQLSSSEPGARAFAADELGGLGAAAAKAVPDLRAALNDRDARVRSSAVMALAAVAGKSAMPDISRALNDKDEDVRYSASTALSRLSALP